jgi:hypothetical protein
MSEETSYYYKWGYEFWDEIYKGEKNSKKERHGIGQVKWLLDVLNEWRFEDWARNKFHESIHNEYDFNDKLNTDRKLTKNSMVFKGTWKNDLPNGKGEFFLNEELIFVGDLVDGNIHGKAKFKINYQTLIFGIYNNYIPIPGFSDEDYGSEKEYSQKINRNQEFGNFDGEFKYGLADGYGELYLKSGLTYKGHWSKGYPYGKGFKTYSDRRTETGEFGILHENTLKLMTDYVDEPNGQLINGKITFANGDTEDIDKRSLIKKVKSIF